MFHWNQLPEMAGLRQVEQWDCRRLGMSTAAIGISSTTTWAFQGGKENYESLPTSPALMSAVATTYLLAAPSDTFTANLLETIWLRPGAVSVGVGNVSLSTLFSFSALWMAFWRPASSFFFASSFTPAASSSDLTKSSTCSTLQEKTKSKEGHLAHSSGLPNGRPALGAALPNS